MSASRPPVDASNEPKGGCMPMWQQRGDSARGRGGAAAKRRPISKFAYRFGSKADTDGDGTMKQQLGGKGAGLAEMSRVGLDVPAGFTLSTDLCALYAEADKEGKGGAQLLEKGAWKEVDLGVKFIEKQMRRSFPRGGATSKAAKDNELPLLLSVRSGAAVSMPGMMDTVLNLGLNDEVVHRFCSAPTTSEAERRFCLDAYRRLLDMFGDVVLSIPRVAFESALTEMKRARGVAADAELTAVDLRQLCDAYQKVYSDSGKTFPADPETQLRMAIEAVFASWNNDRAVKYREINKDCAGLKGTAVNVQSMVFGNRDDDSCSGVLFTRDPSTGTKKLYGEYLVNAQGEDVVAGIRTPTNIDQLVAKFPRCHKTLVDWCDRLENHFWDVMDIEFTVESNKLWILQCRAGKRIGAAAVKIACDMVDEGLITVPRAVLMVENRHLDQLLRPRFDPSLPYDREKDVVAKGLPASPGAAVGTVAFTAADAEAARKRGEDCVLVRVETSAEDVGGMHASVGILTARGGMTSHAAVVARGWGKPCVVGCGDMFVNERDGTVRFQGSDAKFKEGDVISLDGDEGLVIRGSVSLISAVGDNADLARVMRWADETRRIKVLANADTPTDAAIALANGAEGIGLVRTEHQFFSSPERLRAMRSMVLAGTDAARTAACDRMLPFQREDFQGIFSTMSGLPVCVRLLDPPLHEFLPPRKSQTLDRVARDVSSDDKDDKDVGKILARAERMREMNPMLGMRGCRLGIQHPCVTAMQSRAVFEAAKACAAEGIEVKPQIMVPLVATPEEFSHQLGVIREVYAEVFDEGENCVPFEVGAMVETPRAALIADDLVRAGAKFLSLGTNDLTQMTFGFSRDDVGPILSTYRENGILSDDPFERIDERGVGVLVENCARTARDAVREINEQWQEDQSKPEKTEIKIGVCGEHGGDPASVRYFASERVALDYVSCSAHRVVSARLAAAQAAARSLGA